MDNKHGLLMKYFVLKPEGNDIYAQASRSAMCEYARVVKEEAPTLANELLAWVNMEIVNSVNYKDKNKKDSKDKINEDSKGEYDHKSQQLLNHNHAINPMPGDYWSEMALPICVVLACNEKEVIVCTETEPTDEFYWTWNLDQNKFRKYTKEKFRKWLEYPSIPNNYWCDCNPESHKFAVDYVKENNLL